MNSGNGTPMSLALLALLTSAVVVMTGGDGFFSLWDSIVGLLLLSVAGAYKHEVDANTYCRVAFSLCVGAGVVIVAGPFVESAIYHFDPVIEYEGPFLQTPDKLPYDGVFVGIWLLFAGLVYYALARRGREVDQRIRRSGRIDQPQSSMVLSVARHQVQRWS